MEKLDIEKVKSELDILQVTKDEGFDPKEISNLRITHNS